MTTPAPLPEVRQCQIEQHPLWGATAVAVGENRWGIMSIANGGHYGDDAEVADWSVAVEFTGGPQPASEPEPSEAPAAPKRTRPPIRKGDKVS